MKYEIGRNDSGSPVSIDLGGLLEQRLLITANSGGGKSWLLRLILEKTFGEVPHHVLDTEGEFSTLREKHDYILAGRGGDIPADPSIRWRSLTESSKTEVAF